ncbi:hypothetical protein [Nostoc sp. ChiQUE01b]|uniref:hypothetical protein n=1 Tax=Nostoc sp. ChiQUE01b TaxID=3075376 RepID=UPI002AD4CB1A|nr:hypothetical protein [Nostoc sp. ChiQUE01b]MDZ8258028.1 hypothetical protein [Nostoc sp. ChiQUE01b]
MASVLTTSSNVICGHSGNVAVTSTQKLKVGNNPVLVKTSIEGKSVPNCATVPAADATGSTAIKCTTVSSVSSGEATKLKVNKQPVMLDTLSGETNGMVAKITPQKLLAATAGQSKLTAI